MVKRDLSNTQRYVIIGGGPAGLSCAETLRQSGFTGEITLISAEDKQTYDRTQLTKNLASADIRDLIVRDNTFIEDADIDFRLGLEVK